MYSRAALALLDTSCTGLGRNCDQRSETDMAFIVPTPEPDWPGGFGMNHLRTNAQICELSMQNLAKLVQIAKGNVHCRYWWEAAALNR
jgi:hypothetical protein